jgi:hypothetical protein
MWCSVRHSMCGRFECMELISSFVPHHWRVSSSLVALFHHCGSFLTEALARSPLTDNRFWSVFPCLVFGSFNFPTSRLSSLAFLTTCVVARGKAADSAAGLNNLVFWIQNSLRVFGFEPPRDTALYILARSLFSTERPIYVGYIPYLHFQWWLAGFILHLVLYCSFY